MNKYLLILIYGLLMIGCAEDDSSLVYPNQNPNFSLISISSPTDILSVDVGNVLTFTPEVQQGVIDKPLEYIWSSRRLNVSDDVTMEEISTGKTLNYTYSVAGEYQLRLEVKNEDYSEFKSWMVDVRVQDEGLMIIGEDPSGEMMVSFARSLSQTDVLEGKELTFVTDIIKHFNQELTINDVVYVTKSAISYEEADNFMIVFAKEHIYLINGKTFKLANVIHMKDWFPGETIERVTTVFSNSPALIFTSTGRILSFDKEEKLLYESSTYTGTFEDMIPNMNYINWGSTKSDFFNIDYSTSKLWYHYRSYSGTYLLSNTSGALPGTYDFVDDYKPNIYEGRDIISVGRMLGDGRSATKDFFSVSVNKDDNTDVQIVRFIIDLRNDAFYNIENPLVYNTDNLTLQANSQLVANGRYSCFYYNNGSDIYKWDPVLDVDMKLPETPSIQLEGDKEVTCMAISWDMKDLYVGFYDPSYSGELKGGMYVYDAGEIGIVADLQPKQKFEGICTRPVQVFYMPDKAGSYSFR